MKEVKTPRKPFIFYYIIVLLVLMLVNMFVMPMIREASIKKVDYNEFMNMTLNKQIKKVEIDDSQITFTDQNLRHRFRNRCLQYYPSCYPGLSQLCCSPH